MSQKWPEFAHFQFPCPKCGMHGILGDATMEYRGDYFDMDYAGSRSIRECVIHRCPRCKFGVATLPLDRAPDPAPGSLNA